jgi:hypothetical protein
VKSEAAVKSQRRISYVDVTMPSAEQRKRKLGFHQDTQQCIAGIMATSQHDLVAPLGRRALDDQENERM